MRGWTPPGVDCGGFPPDRALDRPDGNRDSVRIVGVLLPRRGVGRLPSVRGCHAPADRLIHRRGGQGLVAGAAPDAGVDRHRRRAGARLRCVLSHGLLRAQRVAAAGRRRPDDRADHRRRRPRQARHLLFPRHLPPARADDPLRGPEQPGARHDHRPAGVRGDQLLHAAADPGLAADPADRDPPRLGVHRPGGGGDAGDSPEHLRRVDAGEPGRPAAHGTVHRRVARRPGDRRGARRPQRRRVHRVGTARRRSRGLRPAPRGNARHRDDRRRRPVRGAAACRGGDGPTGERVRETAP